MKDFDFADGMVIAGLLMLFGGLWLYQPYAAIAITGAVLLLIGLRMQEG